MLYLFFSDESDDYVADSKGKITLNSKSSSSSGSSNGDGEGSGIVAKIFFLILLVSLSLVVGLILVELRGKQGRACCVLLVIGGEGRMGGGDCEGGRRI